ncbi:MlaD family protein [Roseobacter ponti]|uniref:MCE family protein n=1 Tax=Roseobacter ponti TaxID=1891787 RepID=A0A858SRP8_9RHOB|nr:MlaD family protein [Roseobacter ponti]QJF50353.1 MCE family protein [Roseobacter ponti]
METKANYLLIGLFTLAGLVGSMVFLLWLAKVQVDRQYAYYDVLFDNVTGLGDAGDVRFNGLPVGQVVGLALDEEEHSKVRVRIEIAEATPVRTDTVAVLQSQGVTGVSFVALTGGSPDAELLPENAVIPSQSSAIQSVLEGAPVLLQRAVDLLDDISAVVSDENRDAVSVVLNNLASASGRLDRSLADFETLSADLSGAARQVEAFAGRLDALADTADTTLTTATETLTAAQGAITQGQATLATADDAFSTIDDTFASARTLMDEELTPFVRQGRLTATTLDETLRAIEPPARAALETAQTAFDEAGQTFAAANKIISDDLDGIITDMRGAVQVFTTTVRDASGNIDAITDEVLVASRAAAGVAQTLEAIVAGNQRQISNFIRLGLPEFLQFTEDARQLVSNLDRFVDRVERDPARFFLGTQGSEFRR